MATLTGTAGDDDLTGTFTYDTFDLSQGGNDTVNSRSGHDAFTLGAAFNGGDRLNGGGGADSIHLAGDYSAGLTITAPMLTNFEYIYFAAGNSYDITLKDGVNSSVSAYVIYGVNLLAGNVLKFDGSEETSNGFSVYGGGGNDRLTGGEGNDFFYVYYSGGGIDFVSGRGGADGFSFQDTMTRDDRVNGGAGSDILYLNGDYALNMRPTTLVDVETIGLTAGHDYKLTFDDANIAALGILRIDGYSLVDPDKLIVNGGSETDGAFWVRGGGGKDTFNTGAGNDTLDARGGADVLSAGEGDDTLIGGPGHDEMTGGDDQDLFSFAEGDSPFANPDLIMDLALGDAISLYYIDADTTQANDQAFVLVSSFSNTAGELRLDYDSGLNRTFFLMDTDGDGAADQRFAAVGNRTAFTNFEL
jgi:Ca2+-binding RTX toxin-like protein